MNRSILIPRRTTLRKSRLQRTLKFIRDYLHFRNKGFSRKAAIFNARSTL